MVRMIAGTAILALGVLGVLDALLNPAAFKGDATSSAWAFLIVFVIPGSLLFVFGRRARIRFNKTPTLAHLQKPRGGTSAAKTAAPPALDLPSGARIESILAQQVLSEDCRALKVVVLESGFQAGVLSNLLIKVHRVPKDRITQLGYACTDEQMDELLKTARPIVLVPRDLINNRRCVFRLPAGSNLLVEIQFLDGEASSLSITCEGPTFQFKSGWFS